MIREILYARLPSAAPDTQRFKKKLFNPDTGKAGVLLMILEGHSPTLIRLIGERVADTLQYKIIHPIRRASSPSRIIRTNQENP